MILPYLVIAPSTLGGKGVFAAEAIATNTVVEISPVLVFDATEKVALETTQLYNYIFIWGNDHALAALGMGYISLYNHSYDANCHYDMDFENDTMTITTVRPIEPGDELLINYNGWPNDTTPIWFDAK